MANEQSNNVPEVNESVQNTAGGGNVSTRGASALESLNNDLQNVLWSHGINVMSNDDKMALLTRLINTAPPQINVTTSQNSDNLSTIEGDDTIGELPDLENSDGGRGRPRAPGFQPRNPNLTLDPNATPVASGSNNYYSFQGTPWAGQNYGMGTPVGSGANTPNFPPGPTVPMYARYTEPPSTTNSAEAIKSVPKLKKDDTDSYLVFAQKFCTNLIINNLGHATDKKLMKNLLPPSRDHIYRVARDHPWALAVRDNDRVMAF